MELALGDVIRMLFTTNLAVEKRERILVITDMMKPGEELSEEDEERRRDLPVIAREIAEVGRSFCDCIFLEYPSVGMHGAEPPEEVWSAAFGDKVVEMFKQKGLLGRILEKRATPAILKKVEKIIKANSGRAVAGIIALSNYSTSHTRFRDLLCRVCGTRYASMPLFERSMFAGPMMIDWKELERRTNALAERLGSGKEVIVNAPNGTELRMNIEERPVMADTGLLAEPGAFSNLPAGEVFLAPVEGKTEGRLVLEWAPTRKLAAPVTLVIRKGRAIRVLGEEPYAEKLRKILKKNVAFRNIAELGIGTNEKAKRADNILESEKILGTIHIALGDNSTFGGAVKAPFHQDFVLFNPTVHLLKGREWINILKEGRLAV